MPEIEIIDHLGDYWRFLIPPVYRTGPSGLTEMWVYVAKGPACLTEGAYRYQELPLPVFTEWWDERWQTTDE